MTSLLSGDIPNSVIASVLNLNLDLRGWQRNPRIGSTLSETVLKGGKRLRPLFSFLMADLFGVQHEVIAPYARVVELVHASTLAHDDVIDHADTRRGEPSINALTSNKHAVLAGDYLLAYVLDTVSELGNPRIVRQLARIISELAEGEWLQLENAKKTTIQRTDVETVAIKKTGSVLRWCCVVPAILAEANEEQYKLAEELGETIGVAFQISDDILDVLREDGSALADFKNGVISSVLYELIEANAYSLDQKDMSIDATALNEAILKVRATLKLKIQRARDIVSLLEQQLSHERPECEKAALAVLHLISYLEARV